MTTATATARVGILGGTFNPIHIGHLRAAEEVAEVLGLTRMVFVPSADPPHKNDRPYDRIAPSARRLEWVELAIRNNPLFEVDSIEVDRGGASYSVETLQLFAERLAPAKPVFTIGQDAFVEIDSWRDPAELFERAHFAVMTRPPVALLSLSDWMPRCIRADMDPSPDGLSARHRRTDSWIRLIDVPALDISSSDIRLRLREGRSVRYLLPLAVEEAIEKSGAYREQVGPVVESNR